MADDDISIKEPITKETIEGERPFYRFINDKDLVIIGVVVIAVCSMVLIPEPTIIISNIIAGLFGIATGRSMGSGSR
jgi:hypothetical protein